MKEKVLVAMSGGVDSSVAAALMLERGCACMGATMKLHGAEDDESFYGRSCCSLRDVADAKDVAAQLGIPYHLLHFEKEFDEYVIRRFAAEYEAGRTPNPCIECNRRLKFKLLLEKARSLGCDSIVTGHYARIARDEETGRYLLKRGLDEKKDQSYVLYAMTQEELAHTVFPLGEYRKEEIREIAARYGFVNAEKKESQDICFIPDGDYVGFLRRSRAQEKEREAAPPYAAGDFVDETGAVVGRHQGLVAYTIGQRKGLGLSLKEPKYVYRKDMQNNTVHIGPEPLLMRRTLVAEDFNWLSVPPPPVGEAIRVTASTRYRQRAQAAEAVRNADDTVTVTFYEPVRAIAAGQAAVLYDGELVVGGGTISCVCG